MIDGLSALLTLRFWQGALAKTIATTGVDGFDSKGVQG